MIICYLLIFSTYLLNPASQSTLSTHLTPNPLTLLSIHPPHPPSLPIHPSFHQVYGADELSSLETCMRILLGWGVSWQVDFPLPPAHIIDRIDGLLKHHDQRLHMHLHALEPAVLPGVIGMYVSYYTTTHTTTHPINTPYQHTPYQHTAPIHPTNIPQPALPHPHQ